MASKDTNRQRILSVAMEHVKNGTFEDRSIRDFCAEAGITIGIFYRSFPSKDALYCYCYCQLVESFVSTIDLVLVGLPLHEQVIRLALALLAQMGYPGHHRLFSDDPETKAVFGHCHQLVLDKLRQILNCGVELGQVDPAQIPMVIDTFFILLRGSYITSTNDYKPEAFFPKAEALFQHIIPRLLRADDAPRN
nr:TetR/AcrR family transcriptional regulator [Clostridia bacterium]